ncbi:MULTISPECIES: hypothetical protein [Streptomyces]|uniref:hypothetical protein n=1 Tax=Streptomyces TaxID=1883 RepID=UPI002F411E41
MAGRPRLMIRAPAYPPGPARSPTASALVAHVIRAEPTGTYSITMPRDAAEAARDRSGPSAYVAAAVARHAATLLCDAGLHGHEYAIDAMPAATALATPGPTLVPTSGPADLTALRGTRITVIKI